MLKLSFNTKIRLPEICQAPFSEAVRTQNRRAIREQTDRAAVDAVLEALAPLRQHYSVEEMTHNHRGYDILIDHRVRVQIKGATYLDYYSGIFKNFEFDAAVIVDLGVCIRERHRHNGKYPHSDYIGFFIFPRQVVEVGVYRGSRDYGLYAKKDPVANVRPSRNGYRFAEFHQYRDRFDIIGNLVCSGTS